MDFINFNKVEIPPEGAKTILEQNFIGETIFEHKDVIEIANAISSDRWIFNGDALVFDINERLVDGAKRLAACVNAGKPIKTFVITDVPLNKTTTLGTHRKRRLSDHVKIYGADNHDIVSKVGSLLPSLATGTYKRKTPPPPELVLGIYEANKEAFENATKFVKGHTDWLDHSYMIVAWHFILSRIDRAKAEKFLFEALNEHGSRELPPKDPASTLNYRFYKAKYEEDGSFHVRLKATMVIGAWNARWNNKKQSRPLTLKNDGEVPTLEGWPGDVDLDVDPVTLCHVSGSLSDDANDPIGEFLTITPEMAADFLHNHNFLNNRRIAATSVQKYARDMKANDWQPNGQAIKFDTKGKLIDGQHRCRACVESGVPFKSLVVRNVQRSAFLTYDTTPSRTFVQVLSERGQRHAKTLSPLVNRLCRWDAGTYHVKQSPSIPQMDAYLSNNSFLIDVVESELSTWIREGDRLRNGIKQFRPASAMFVYALLYRINKSKAEDFMSRVLIRGFDSDQDQQVLDMCKAIHKWRTDNKHKITTKDEIVEVSALIKSWNAWVKGAPLNVRGLISGRGDEIPQPLEPLVHTPNFKRNR